MLNLFQHLKNETLKRREKNETLKRREKYETLKQVQGDV